MIKKTDGFTLVELMVGILCAAVVTGAAISVMLMNARINRTVIDANVDQQDTRIITSLVENLASEGGIASVKYVHNTASDKTDWALLDGKAATATSILSYSSKNETISGRDGAVLMSGVLSSSVSISRGVLNGCLLNLSIETKAGQHETSVYCRTSELKEFGFKVEEDADLVIDVIKPDDSEANTETIKPVTSENGRLAFLSVLASQVGSGGYIDGDMAKGTYSLWYCQEGSGNPGYLPGWNASTPWCGCFISWAVAQVEGYSPAHFQKFANVDAAWSIFKDASPSLTRDRSYTAIPGDLIFFSWDSDTTRLEHVGAVLYVDSPRGYVYTIEGNSSNQVALRRYPINDPDIVGYGVLNWNSTTTP